MGLGLVLVGVALGATGAGLALIYGGGLWLALGLYVGLGGLGTLLAAGLMLWRSAAAQDQLQPAPLPVTPVPQSPGR